MDDELDAIWKALADPTRRGLLDLLRHGPMTTGELAGEFPELTRFGVMKHLGVLESAGLVLARKEGRKKVNALNAVPLRRVYERWVSKYQDTWAGGLTRLKAAAEERERAMPTKTAECRVETVHTEITIAADRETVFETFVNDFGAWFYENEQKKLETPGFIEPRVGGAVYFKIPGAEGKPDGFNTLATITMIKPGKKLRMRGDFTLPQAFLANVTIAFEDAGAGTAVKIEHRMFGELYDGLSKEFEEGWYDGLKHLKALVESK